MSLDLVQLETVILAWGRSKGIIGDGGKGTPNGQARKMAEEAVETAMAVAAQDMEEIEDGIGDVFVTIVLLAHMHGMDLKQCAGAAYEVIAGRTGEMVNGVFVKD